MQKGKHIFRYINGSVTPGSSPCHEKQGANKQEQRDKGLGSRGSLQMGDQGDTSAEGTSDLGPGMGRVYLAEEKHEQMS